MKIPLIPAQVFHAFIDTLFSGFEQRTMAQANDTINKGIHLAGKCILADHPNEGDAVRDCVLGYARNLSESSIVAAKGSAYEKAMPVLLPLITVFSLMATLVSLAAYFIRSSIPPIAICIFAVVFAVSNVATRRMNSSMKSARSAQVASSLASLTQDDMVNMWYTLADQMGFRTALGLLCQSSNVECADFETRIRRLDDSGREAKGVNDNIEFLEMVCLYQNLACYFNEVYPSQGKGDIGEVVETAIPIYIDRLNEALDEISSERRRQETAGVLPALSDITISPTVARDLDGVRFPD